MPCKILITGATGFIGSHLINRLLDETDWEILSLERLPSRVATPVASSRIQRIYQDLLSPVQDQVLRQLADVRYIVHAGAEVSGPRSVVDPRLSIETSVLGTYHLLEAARMLSIARFVFISSGEAVGAAPDGVSWDESAALRPSNPYAAAKAAAETLCESYRLSFDVPMLTVRSMNLFGSGQSFERFIPMVIKAILNGEEVTCHVDANHRPGSRNWLHVSKFTSVLLPLILSGEIGETYHVVGPERNNVYIIETLARILGRSVNIHPVLSGPSHDMRYALRDTKLNLSFDDDFFETLVETAHWYQENLSCLVS